MEFVLLKPAFFAFAFSVFFTPVLIWLSHKKGFFASTNDRSSHQDTVPNTGGIVLCFAVLLPLLFFSQYPSRDDFSALIAAFAVLLITGVIDDFNPLPVIYKFFGQFIPAIVIATSINESELIIPFVENLQLPFIFNYLFWIFFIVMVINAFNLIDGIDGLALSLGIVGGIFYFFNFQRVGDTDLMIFSLAMVGGLTGLLFYNFSRKNKIFIGDTGSLLIGGFLVYFALKYMYAGEGHHVSDSFFMVIASIFLPFMDMFRVAMVRMIRGESPFKADRKHLHHMILLFCKGNHALATLIIVLSQIGIIIIFSTLRFDNPMSYAGTLIISAGVYFLILFMVRYRQHRGRI